MNILQEVLCCSEGSGFRACGASGLPMTDYQGVIKECCKGEMCAVAVLSSLSFCFPVMKVSDVDVDAVHCESLSLSDAVV